MPQLRARAWCFTVNNDTFEDLSLLLDADFQYLIIGCEVGEQGTPHLQGYIYFTNARSQNSVKKILPRAHLLVAKGSPNSNYDYCSKDGSFYEFGDKPLQGRAVYDKIVEAMENPMDNFHLYHQYRKAFNEYKNSVKKEHTPQLIILSEKDKYNWASLCTATVSMWPSVYDGEDVRIEPCYTQGEHEIFPWLHKMPLKYSRGYEVKYENPEVLVITYKDNYERNYLIKTYGDFLDAVLEPEK